MLRSRRAATGPRHPFRADGQVIARRGPILNVERTDGHISKCTARRRGKAAVVGDWVQLEGDVVAAVGPRQSVIRRADPRRTSSRRPLVTAANVQRLFVVSAVEPPFKLGLIDRYLVAADAEGIEAHVVVNKVDLLDDPEWLAEALSLYPALGYPLHLVSAARDLGLEALRGAVAGQLCALVGQSGVGKTSLLNALLPGLHLKTEVLSGATGKGQHTTSATTLYRLGSGGALIDSPGVRSFGLVDIEARELRDHFVELRELARGCRFGDCQHLEEPGCAVLEALDVEAVHPSRYDSYVRIHESLLADGH